MGSTSYGHWLLLGAIVAYVFPMEALLRQHGKPRWLAVFCLVPVIGPLALLLWLTRYPGRQ